MNKRKRKKCAKKWASKDLNSLFQSLFAFSDENRYKLSIGQDINLSKELGSDSLLSKIPKSKYP